MHAVIQRILWLWYQTQQHHISVRVGSISLCTNTRTLPKILHDYLYLHDIIFYSPLQVPVWQMSSGILSYFPCCTRIPVSCSVKLGNTGAGGMLMCPWLFLMLLIPTIKTNKIKIINAASQSLFQLVLPCQRTLSRHNKVESCSLSATCSPNTSAAKASLHLHTRVLIVVGGFLFVCFSSIS